MPLISDHIKGPLVAAFRSSLMKVLDRSVETLGLWIITSSVTFIKSVNQSSIKPCLIVHLIAVWTLIYFSQRGLKYLRRLALKILKSLSMKGRCCILLHLQLVCDEQFFLSQLQYTGLSLKIPCQYIFVRFTMIRNIFKCLNSVKTEFNSFKIKIFTTLKGATFCFIFSWQNMQIPKSKKDKATYICFGLHCGQAIQLQKQKLSCCSLLIVSRHVANISF